MAQIVDRKMARDLRVITARVLAHVEDIHSPRAAAEQLGCSVHDLSNMRRGKSLLSSTILLRLVRKGRYTPRSIVVGPRLRRQRRGTSIAGSTENQVAARARKIAWSMPGAELPARTGLSARAGWTLRYGKAHITAYWILGLLRAGYKLDYLIFGR